MRVGANPIRVRAIAMHVGAVADARRCDRDACSGVNKAQIQVYLEFVPEFAKKYGTDLIRITIPSNAPKWEGFVKTGTYRLDLQGTESGFGNIQAQFGTGHENCNKGGSYGGVLMLCSTPFTVEEVQEALRMSLATKGTSLVQMALEVKRPRQRQP